MKKEEFKEKLDKYTESVYLLGGMDSGLVKNHPKREKQYQEMITQYNELFDIISFDDGSGMYWCEEHGHEQTVPCPDCGGHKCENI